MVDNRKLCREHYRLTLRTETLPAAYPGQFVNVRPATRESSAYRVFDSTRLLGHQQWAADVATPLLRRAFSIAGIRREHEGVDIDLIYRVVGTATRWMESLSRGQSVSVVAPLGNGFPLRDDKTSAWLVAGGVGLPPMLFFAEVLNGAGRRTVAFCGAQTSDLLPLELNDEAWTNRTAVQATLGAAEFARHGSLVIVSTDDGSCGYHGHVGAAMTAYNESNPTFADDLVVYTCGPEPMMRFIAEYCGARGIECYVCMERSMACGVGTCQSCVVPVRDRTDPEGWGYRLCCAEGPVFEASTVIWEPADLKRRRSPAS